MLERANDMQADVSSIFVTTDDSLKKEVKKLCEQSIIVSNPDILVTSLYLYSKNSINMKPTHLVFLLKHLDINEVDHQFAKAQQEDLKTVIFAMNDEQFQNLNAHFEDQQVQVFKHENYLGIRNKVIEDLNLFPEQITLVSDEPEAIQYFRKSGFGYLIGCGEDHQKLSKHLADHCITSLKDLDFDDIKHWFKETLDLLKWCLTYRYFDKDEEKLRETMTTVGNGFVGHRNALSFMKADDDTHYPGTYIASLFNKVGRKLPTK